VFSRGWYCESREKNAQILIIIVGHIGKVVIVGVAKEKKKYKDLHE
jgi:hypothetical protein